MKITLRNILTVILSIAAAACMAFGLAACKPEAKVTGLILDNVKTDFIVGDEFTLGDGVIYALYDDGSKRNVTADVELKKEPGFDMNVSDEYQITVSYGGKKEVYSIYVSDYTNVLKKIELDTTEVKTQYSLGDAVSFDGLKITATYENAQGRLIIFHLTSLKNFTVEIKSQSGTVADDAFMELGDYTVTVSQGNVKSSYAVKVEGISMSNAQSAVNIGKIFSTQVVSGTQAGQASLQGGEYFSDINYSYKYGDNYTYVKETYKKETLIPGEDGAPDQHVTEDVVIENHFSLYDDEIFCARYENGSQTTNPLLVAEMMEGPTNLLWYGFLNVYGIENTLVQLYKAAKECTNKDLVETANVANRSYSFTFSGLVNHGSRPDYYETTVSFTLGEKYNVQHAEYVQKYWENNETAAGASWYVPTFVTDSDGKTTPNTNFSKAVKIVVDQQTGERTEKNPYSKSQFNISSFDLTYNGTTLEAPDATIPCSMSNPRLEIKIENIMPETANFTMDRLLFSYVGNRFGYEDSAVALDFGPSRGFGAYRDGNTIKINLKGGGTWTLLIKTGSVEKSITFEVTGEAPTELEPFIRNEASGNFYKGDTKIVALGGEVYFYGNVSMGLDGNQTATVTSANSANATIEKTESDGTSCFKFTATAAGTYTVKVVSDSNKNAFCEFTFTVSETPDYEKLLSGKYSVKDMGGNIYEFTFTLESSDPVKGKLAVTKTPTDSEGTPDAEGATSQTFDFSVNAASMEILLVGDQGNTLGIDLSINAEGKLVLNDVKENNYVLERVSE